MTRRTLRAEGRYVVTGTGPQSSQASAQARRPDLTSGMAATAPALIIAGASAALPPRSAEPSRLSLDLSDSRARI